MSVQRIPFLFLSGSVVAAALVGCQPQDSKNTPQPMIVPNYNATYDAGQKTVTFQSKFLFGPTSAATTAIQLKGGSIVKINDAQMKESSKVSRAGAAPEYGYEFTLNDVAPEALGKPYVFTYVDNDGRAYANEALIPQPVAGEIPAGLDRAQGLQIPWSVGDQLAKNEIVYAKLKFRLSDAASAAFSQEGAKSGTVAMGPQEFAGLQPGQVQITLCRQKIADKVNAASGGRLTTEYCLPTQTVEMK